MIVVDASVLASALSDESSEGACLRARLEDEQVLYAPELIDLEIATVWRRQIRLGWIDDDRAQNALADLASLNLVRVSHLPLMARIWELRHNVTAYDASYVALAEALQATLLTSDGKLARAPALGCAIELVESLGSDSRSSRRSTTRRALPDGYELDDDVARVDIDMVHRYLSESSYWARGRTRERQVELNSAAARVVGCYVEGGRQLGYGRAVSDGVSIAYLADVFVLPEARGRGLGREIVRELVERGPLASLRWLLHTEDGPGLYEPFGFVPPVRSVLERPAGGGG